jgi:hypothetical protein
MDDEEAIATLDGQLLSSLVGVVSEVDFNVSVLDLKASRQKSKSTSMLKSQKRVRVPKSKFVS